MMGRRLCSTLDLVKPDLESRVAIKQNQQKFQHDNMPEKGSLQWEILCFAKNWKAGPTWVPATVIAQTGPISFKVELENSKTVWRRHQDQLRKRYKELTNKETYRTDKEDTLSVHSDSLMDVDVSSTDTSTESFDIENEE